MMRRITLLTDFGTGDGYVAAMKGVIAGIAPEARVEDAAHSIRPGDVASGAWALGAYWRFYPAGTVHVAVVDPGVGGGRRGLGARVDGRLFVAPDNGILSRVLDQSDADLVVALENPSLRRPEVAPTFHGRDIFAPAAAHLALGVPLDSFGPPVRDPVRIPIPRPERGERGMSGVVVHVDRFGNLITNLTADVVEPGLHVEVEGRAVGPLRRTYSDVATGAALALIGSTGALEIAVRDGSAAATLGLGRGARVTAVPGSRPPDAAPGAVR